jgi:cytochrome c
MLRPRTSVIGLVVAALTVTIAVSARAADAGRGELLYLEVCSGCHSLDADRVGPAHRGVFGRTSGAAPGFAYSAAVRSAGIVWNEATLDRWLTDPQALIPGQGMNFRVNAPDVRADIIAFLKRESGR